MVHSDCKAGSFRVETQKRNDSYHYKSLPVRCGQFMLFIIASTRPIGNWAIAPIFLFLKEGAPNLAAIIIGIECVRPSVFGRAWTGGLKKDLFNNAAAALSFSSSEPNVSVESSLMLFKSGC